MLEYTIIVLLVVFSLSYLSFLWSIRSGLSFLSHPRVHSKQVVSVIIPVRNEETNIETCIRALLDQSYERDLYELIVVDDHSKDNTAIIATRIAESILDPKIRLETLTDTSGKVAGVSRGVSVARGDIILCTDADCSIPMDWIESMVGCFETSVVFVAGPVLERPIATIFSRVQALEYMSLTTTSAGLIGSGKPIICSGASIGYRKSAFLQVGGFGDHNSTCDDETLMQRMILRNVGRVVFNGKPTATVLTETSSSLREFWRQRTRWASKKGRYEDGSILRRLLLIYFYFLVMLCSGAVAVIVPALRLPFTISVMVKAVAEYLVLKRGATVFRFRFGLGEFLIAELLHVPYIAIAGLIGQFKSLRWKDRNLDR